VLKEKPGHFANAADVFGAVFGAEAEVAIQSVAHLIAVQQYSLLTLFPKFFLQRFGNGALSGSGNSGEPKDDGFVAVAGFAGFSWYVPFLPNYVW
jgi:hypothetical protein